MYTSNREHVRAHTLSHTHRVKPSSDTCISYNSCRRPTWSTLKQPQALATGPFSQGWYT